MKRTLLTSLLLIGWLFAVAVNPVETVESIRTSRTCAAALDLHLTASDNAIAHGATINLTSEDAWLFFDNVRPNEVISAYAAQIFINGRPMDVKSNCRVVIYKQGAVVMPYPTNFEPLTAYTGEGFTGKAASYAADIYYCDNPDEAAPLDMVKPMPQDNSIRSFRLKRGYMATFACDADGLGYSRIYIADTADIKLLTLPKELDHNISFVRVSKWQYTSKKGWAGSYWKEAPKGLQYVGEQSDLTRSTWYYNWGSSALSTTNPAQTDSSYNQEFVPEKWGAGGSWNGVFSVRNVSHLMGYNEPDHTEQSNVSVETAIKEWPRLMKTGLRLGSPATTSNDWLFEFMKEAKKRNYRVDFVVVHAYWGGLSGKEWYDKLKVIHETTGRPLWIKEWNNGANWTNEGWPDGTVAQQQKQLSDLKEILTVMDTTSFIERYAIYNWVEDKRAIILDGELTPAGQYYAANNAPYFLNADKVVMPIIRVREAPVLSYFGYTHNDGITLSWTDYNGEQISGYTVERSLGGDYETIAQVEMPCDSFMDLPPWEEATGFVNYRLKQHPLSGSGKTSNIVHAAVVANAAERPVATNLLIDENWALAKLQNAANGMFYLLSPATYRNKMPLAPTLRHAIDDAADLRLAAYDYQASPTLANPDTIALLVLPQTASFDGLTSERSVIDSVGSDWKTVDFSTSFISTPAVFATQISANRPYASTVHIQNVTPFGFQVSVQHEEAIEADDIKEQVAWLAVATGEGTLGDYAVNVGLTIDAAVGDNLSGGFSIETRGKGQMPLFFAQMQTFSDSITATLRIKNRSSDSVTLIKDREKSASYGSVLAERVAWMTLAPVDTTSSIRTSPIVNVTNGVEVYDLNGRKLSAPCGLCIVNRKKVIY